MADEIKKVEIPCIVNGGNSTSYVFIGHPSMEHNPIEFQAKWLSDTRGVEVPQKVMDAFAELQQIANKNGVSFPELCTYAFKSLQAPPQPSKVEELGKAEIDKTKRIGVETSGEVETTDATEEQSEKQDEAESTSSIAKSSENTAKDTTATATSGAINSTVAAATDAILKGITKEETPTDKSPEEKAGEDKN